MSASKNTHHASRPDHADETDRTGRTCPNSWHRTVPAGTSEACAECPETVARIDDHRLLAEYIGGNRGAFTEIMARVNAGAAEARRDIAAAYLADPADPGEAIEVHLAAVRADTSIYGQCRVLVLEAHLQGRAQAARDIADTIATREPHEVPARLTALHLARAAELDELPPKEVVKAEVLRGHRAGLVAEAHKRALAIHGADAVGPDRFDHLR